MRNLPSLTADLFLNNKYKPRLNVRIFDFPYSLPSLPKLIFLFQQNLVALSSVTFRLGEIINFLYKSKSCQCSTEVHIIRYFHFDKVMRLLLNWGVHDLCKVHFT